MFFYGSGLDFVDVIDQAVGWKNWMCEVVRRVADVCFVVANRCLGVNLEFFFMADLRGCLLPCDILFSEIFVFVFVLKRRANIHPTLDIK
jgi:hypothetical protein